MIESEKSEIEEVLQDKILTPTPDNIPNNIPNNISNNIPNNISNSQERDTDILSSNTQIINVSDINETENKNIEYSMNKILKMVTDAYKIIPDVGEDERINTVKEAAYAWNSSIEESTSQNLNKEEMLNNALNNAKNIIFYIIKKQYDVNHIGGKKQTKSKKSKSKKSKFKKFKKTRKSKK